MPNNMKKAGIKYKNGGPKKKTAKDINVTDSAKEASEKIKSYWGTTKRGHGGKAPVASDYMGNPMGYFGDKARYGKQKLMKAQTGKGLDDWLEKKTDGLINKVPGYKAVKNFIKDAKKEKEDAHKKANYPKINVPDVRKNKQ